MSFKSFRLPGDSDVSILGSVVVKSLAPIILREVAPKIWGSIKGQSGRAEPVLEAVEEIATDVLRLPPDASVENVQAALRENPDVARQIAEFAMQERVAMAKEQTRLEELATQDRASARDMHIKTGGRAPAILAAVAALFSFTGLGAAVWLNIEGQEPSTLVVTAITASLGFFASVVSFHFGSSAGSKAKTEAMADELRSLSGRR